jgi:hypothetical protein
MFAPTRLCWRALLTPNMDGNGGARAVEDAYEAGLQRITDAKEKYNPSRNAWQSDPRRDLANVARIIMGIFRRPSQRGNVLTSNLAAHCPLCLTMVLWLAASGCVALDANDSVSTPRAVAVPPDEKKLAELVNAAFTTASFLVLRRCRRCVPPTIPK